MAMAYLVYCVLRHPIVLDEPLKGLMDKDVFFVTAPSLCMAVSDFDSEEHMPNVPELLVYGNVVEYLFRRQTVIPMRFGCFLDGLPDIQRILEEKKHQYDTLLMELDGCVEMGIRILLPHRVLETQKENEIKNVDGCQYLARRKEHYLMQEEISRYHQALLDRCIQVFSELSRRHRTETVAKNDSVVASLYFLIPKNETDRFRQNFHRFVEKEETKLLMSGPWPPYNFVTAEPPLNPSSKEERKGKGLL
jgi:hypothetical protein